MWSFQLIHIKNQKKREKTVPFTWVIHIIHIKTCVFGELLLPEKRTDVLVSCDENKILSKKPDKILDFWVFKRKKNGKNIYQKIQTDITAEVKIRQDYADVLPCR